MICTNIENLRDPFLVCADGTYYIYGTGIEQKGNWEDTVWVCYKNISGKLDGEWKRTEKLVYERPENAAKNLWAPEVHKYNGAYYMFATYYSSLTNHRGCTILRADSPEGPFLEITDGHITPAEWDAIDGTLYVDKDGQPWMIFCHEWTCTDDGVGRMSAAKLSDDLTHFVSAPKELFRADSPSWTDERVTDGCFMYTTSDGELLMLWSNFYNGGYCVAVAKSDNGRMDGNWLHEEKPAFSAETTGKHDGGHGMIFKDADGKMYLILHSPNIPTGDCPERTVLVPINEKNGTLVCGK